MLTLIIVLSYLLGSASGSLMLGRLRGVDIRTMGSGNAGGTNALRTQGFVFALGVALIDVGKGVLAAYLAQRGMPESPDAAYLAALAAVLGHVWPVFHGFRGGKGAGTLVGALLVLWPLAVGVLIATWLLVLTASGYVGLSTVLAAATLVPLAWLTDADALRWAFAAVLALFIAFTHRANLARLRAGTEAALRACARLWTRLRRNAA